MRPPLELPDERWRWRWMVLPSWNVLHRVSEFAPDLAWGDGNESPYGDGVTVCGCRGHLAMPGVISRLSLPRCKHCCRHVGIPYGAGTPVNDATLWPEKLRAA